jgi:eukaryotic-like serine/threonine-protein kinase
VNDPSTHAVHRLLSGRYALEQHLGSGGAGAVWRAHDQLLGRTVAVKLLHVEVAQDPVAARRFRTEASMAAKLTHPNAVIVYDIGRDEDHDYLVMEFVEGGTLADVLAGGPMAPGVVAGVGAQVGHALGAAHQRQLVHRDVKPANVLITTEGVAKVADFGIAQALGATSSRLTLPSQVMGTARYLAPEQLRGETVDARADVYALGVLLHEALTGEVPFGEGTMAEVASRRLVADLPMVSELRADVPFALGEAIARATQRDPDARFAGGSEFAAELARSATPGSRRGLAARLARCTSLPAARQDGTTVTSELAADDTSHATPVETSRRPDEPTAAMSSHPTPLARPARVADAAWVADASVADASVADDGEEPRDLDDPERQEPAPATPVTPAASNVPEERDELELGGLGIRPRGRRAVFASLVLVVLIGAGVALATLERPDDGRSPGDGIAGEERAAEDPETEAGSVAEAFEHDEDDGDSGDEDDGGEDGASTFVEIVDARDHDPFGSGEEHRGDVANAFDGDTTTSWQTQGYQGSPELGGLKPGVGIWLDLGDARQVDEVEVAMAAPGASFTLYAGSSPPDPGASPDGWGSAVAEVTGAEELTRLTLDEPTEGRVWLLWFTSLPPDGSVFRASVSDVRLVNS